MSDRKRLAHLVRSTRQHEVLIRLVRAHGWQRGAEIGVLRGKTLFALLDAVPTLTMCGVDQWQHVQMRPDENAETYTDFNMDHLFESVSIRSIRYGDRCQLFRGDSAEMASAVLPDGGVAFADGSLDFVFIDGDHTEPGVERDILAWAPKVRLGGMLLGHDHHWSTVRRVIDRLCPGWHDEGEAVWSLPVDGVRL